MSTPRHVVIVGASSALAQAVAADLHRRNILVSGLGRTRTGNDIPFEEIDYHTADWPALFDKLAASNPIDAILHVPGYVAFGPALDIPTDEARKIFEANFWLMSTVATAAARHWLDRKQYGDFWAVSSIAALRAIPSESYYAASKAAASRWLECLDLENRTRGLRFRAFHPGKFSSPFRFRAAKHGSFRESPGSDTDVAVVAQIMAEAIATRRPAHVIGWRENIIVLADRLVPGLYDRWLLRQQS